jgi:glutamate-ammonia-ligase adenylyltransferase
MLDRAVEQFAADHGRVRGGRIAILALGKLGSREMTAASDLDLILIYDYPSDAGESDGAKPLGAAVYYSRFTQRFLAALTAPTRRGTLYEVDMRLRPSGRQGPLATQLSAFALYQRDQAETWEHMALTRARVVAGDQSLAEDVARAVRETLTRKRDPARVAAEVSKMRALVAREKGDHDPWDLKLVRGGLMDIEFVAQCLSLAFAHARPEILDVSTRKAIDKAGLAGLVEASHVETLVEAHRLYTDATQFMRLAIAGPFDPKTAAAGVKRRIAAASGFPDFEAFVAALDESRKKVREAYEAIVTP